MEFINPLVALAWPREEEALHRPLSIRLSCSTRVSCSCNLRGSAPPLPHPFYTVSRFDSELVPTPVASIPPLRDETSDPFCKLLSQISNPTPISSPEGLVAI